MADAKKSIIDTATEIAEAGLAQIESAADTVKEKAGPILAQAKEKAAEALTEAKENATPVLAEVRDQAAEEFAERRAALSEAAGHIASQAAELAASGKELAATQIASLKQDVGVEQEKSGGRLKKILLIGGLAALGAVILKRLKGRTADDNWESSYTPAPPPASPAAGAPMGADEAVPADGAGATPDEAVADAAEEAHEITTPEQPAEVVDLDSARKSDDNS